MSLRRSRHTEYKRMIGLSAAEMAANLHVWNVPEIPGLNFEEVRMRERSLSQRPASWRPFFCQRGKPERPSKGDALVAALRSGSGNRSGVARHQADEILRRAPSRTRGFSVLETESARRIQEDDRIVCSREGCKLARLERARNSRI